MKARSCWAVALALAAARAPARAAFTALKDACREDEQRLCRDSTPAGGEAVLGCLQFYAIDLSADCRKARPALQAKSAQDKAVFKAACGEDAKAWCPASTGGWTVTVKCLTLHDENLSKACRDYGIDLRRRLEERLVVSGREACAGDGARLCAGKTYGAGLEQCLTEYSARLSISCRKGLRLLDRTEEMKRVESLRERDAKAKTAR